MQERKKGGKGKEAYLAKTASAAGGSEYRTLSYSPPTRWKPPAGSAAVPADERVLGFVPTAVTVRPSVGRLVSVVYVARRRVACVCWWQQGLGVEGWGVGGGLGGWVGLEGRKF